MHGITHRKPYNIVTLIKTSNPVYCADILHSSGIERKFRITVDFKKAISFSLEEKYNRTPLDWALVIWITNYLNWLDP